MSVAAVEHGASFERVLHALEEAGQQVRRNGPSQAVAQCPAHPDGDPSLSVSWKSGKTLLHCFNGCTDGPGGRGDPSTVLEALHLTPDDLFDEPRPPQENGRQARPPRRRSAGAAPAAARPAGPAPLTKKDLLGKVTGRWQVVAEYVYTSETGEPLGKVIREQRTHEHGTAKRFWQRHATGQCTRDPCDEKRGGLRVLHTDGWGKDAPARKVLYQLPRVIAAIAAGQEVWLPEGEKDADALNFHFEHTGYEAVATTNASGARSWRSEYAQALAGAHVVIVEDKDPPKVNPRTGEAGEPDGRRRTRMLLAALPGLAASVRVVRAKAGKDSFDHLAAGYGLQDFEAVTVPAGDLAGTPAGGPERAGLRLVRSGGHGPGGGGGAGGGEDDDWLPNRRTRYLVRHGEIVKEVTDRSGATRYDVILGCTAQITRVDQKILSGEETPATTGYVLQVEHPGREGDVREISVTRKSWDSGDWLHDLPWPGVTYDSSRNGIAKVRDAVRMTSPGTAVTQVHGAPGWVTDGGKWLYVHAGGALGADGPAAVAADLPSKLARYCLPGPPATPQALREAADHSVGLPAALPPRIGAVLAGLAYRAAISRMPPAVTLIGPPASYKTSMAKVALHHFAPDLPWDESVLSLSERGATGNAAAKLMNLARDTLLLADDAAPDRSLRAAAERVAQIVRTQYNGEVRDRLDREAELQRPTPPRGSLLVSAEVGPSAASASQRTLLVPFTPGQISRDTRVALWERESRHARAAVTASFITWQAGRRDEVLARLEELTGDYAAAWHEAGFDERTAEALAHLAAGWRLMLMHLAESGAYSAEETAVIWERAWEGLAEAGRTQADPDEPADPAAKILSRLRTGLLGRYGHLTTLDGTAPPPDEAPRYGWAVDTPPARGSLVPEPVTIAVRAAGADPVGCYADSGGERRLWLIPELCLIMLRRVSDRLGEPFEETVKSVSSALHQAGIGLAVTPVPSTGMTRRAVQRQMPGSIGGKRRPWVWDIPESALYDGPDGHAGTGPAGDGGNVGPTRFDGTDTHAGDPGGGPTEEDPCPHEPSQPGPAGEEDAVPADAAAAGAGPGTLIRYRQLLDLAAGDGQRNLSPAVLRRRYCTVEHVDSASAQPCAGCGGSCTVLVGGVPLHLTCPDPEPGWQPASAAAADTGAPAGSPDACAAAGPDGQGRALRRRARGDPDISGERWRAPAAVLDADGIYLPGGEKLRLPADITHAGDLADLPARLNLGWGGGRLPPFTGQLWLTAAFLEQVAGLPVPAAAMPVEEREALLTEAAGRPFITGAAAAGWEISEASRARLGHRMRVWREANRAGAQLVFLPYITGDVALMDGQPAPAALAARLETYARLTGVPYGRSAAYSGHDLVLRMDARRKIVLTGPADPVPVRPTSSGLIDFQRAPAGDETRMRFLHSYDATAAWLAASQGTELGVGGWVHRDRPAFDPKLTALWRIQRPKWDLWAIPDPFAPSRKPADGTVRLYTPLLAMAAELLDAEITPVEAWVWPEHTRYLDKWVQQLDQARQALAGPEPSYTPQNPDDAAVLAAIKDTYSGAVTLFGSPQLDQDTDPETGTVRRQRHRLFREDWAHTLIDTSAARLYRKILAVEAAEPGRWPVAIDRDNLLYASDDPDPDRACPAALTIGNGLGQVKPKGSAMLAAASAKLGAGKFSFDTLISRAAWDPDRGGPREQDK